MQTTNKPFKLTEKDHHDENLIQAIEIENKEFNCNQEVSFFWFEKGGEGLWGGYCAYQEI